MVRGLKFYDKLKKVLGEYAEDQGFLLPNPANTHRKGTARSMGIEVKD